MLPAHLAARLEPNAPAPREIRGLDVRVDAERLTPFLHSLVHVLRNAVDHGIEGPAQRGAKGRSGQLVFEVLWHERHSSDGTPEVDFDSSGTVLQRFKHQPFGSLAYSHSVIDNSVLATPAGERGFAGTRWEASAASVDGSKPEQLRVSHRRRVARGWRKGIADRCRHPPVRLRTLRSTRSSEVTNATFRN